jgi:predicted XRE-type DNA-binding protein
MRFCDIDGCKNKHKAHGYCVKHYERFKRYGNPLKGKTFINEPKKLIEEAINSKTDDCIEWKFSLNKNGYAHLSNRQQKTPFVHRIVASKCHSNPENKPDVAHICNNRKCINPRHLRWTTKKENSEDRIMHNTNGIRISNEDVLAIRNHIEKGIKQSTIAKEFNVDQSLISRIKNKKRWKGLK